MTAYGGGIVVVRLQVALIAGGGARRAATAGNKTPDESRSVGVGDSRLAFWFPPTARQRGHRQDLAPQAS
jgi:hypothetical protein